MSRHEQKFTFAPKGYRSEWQHAPRNSGIPHGYFQPVPLWRHGERLVFWVAIASLAAALVFGG